MLIYFACVLKPLYFVQLYLLHNHTTLAICSWWKCI